MAGIDSITGEILKEAQDRAKAVNDRAVLDVQTMRDAAQGEIQEMQRASAEKSERDVRDYAARIRSAIDIQKKKSVLSAKQEIIDDVIRKAYDQLTALDDEAYFDMIRKILTKSVQAGDGRILFSARDLKRLPQGFASDAAKIAAAKGGTLTVSETPGNIESGFILSYGGIEENCSLKAIFDAGRDQMQDKVNKVLFS